MKNVVRALFVALSISALGGCATIPEPKIFSEKKEPVQLLPVKKVLVVIDMSLEFDRLPSGFAYSKQDNAKTMYEPVAKAMVNEVRSSGGQADFLLHTTKASLNIPAEYSHIWMQRLNRITVVTRTSHTDVTGHIWIATIEQRPVTAIGAKFTPVFTSEYEADSGWCFMPPAIGNKEDCQKKYFAIVLPQWKKSGF